MAIPVVHKLVDRVASLATCWTGHMTIVVLRTWLAMEVLMVEKLATRVEGFLTY